MTMTRTLLQLTVVLGLALGAGACQTLADLDPTGLLSSDSDAALSQFPDDAAPTASDTAIGTTPDLASLPDRPPTASPSQQQQTVQSLAADGAQVQYSADALRGGTEAAAPPPGMAGPVMAMAAPSASDAPPTTDSAPTAGPMPEAMPPAPASAPMPSAAPPAPVRSAALPSGGQPAVPADTPVQGGGMMARGPVSDAALGFRPSSAPPLDPSISNWVAAPIVDRYRQTASNAATSSFGAAVPGRAGSGAVLANAGAIPAATYARGGVTPTAVVQFPGDGTTLSAAARTQIRSAVQAYKAGGGVGNVRVVGHASSRTPNMTVERHLETIFDKSQRRAAAVAQELIQQGIPADRVLVEAVGDSQPIYYESMPQGEAGNRRAEIFIQG